MVLGRDLNAALESLLQAVELDPDSKPAMSNLAYVLLLLGQFDDSRTVYEGLMDRFPNDDVLLFAYSAEEFGLTCSRSLCNSFVIFLGQFARMLLKATTRLP